MGFLVGTGVEIQGEREARKIRESYEKSMANEILEYIDRLWVKLEEDDKKISSSLKLTKLNKKYSKKFIKLQNLKTMRYVSAQMGNYLEKKELEGLQLYDYHVIRHPLLKSCYYLKPLNNHGHSNIVVPVKDGFIIIQNEVEQNIKRLRKIEIVEAQMQQIEQEMSMYDVNPTAKTENDIISGISKVKKLVPSTINNSVVSFRSIRL